MPKTAVLPDGTRLSFPDDATESEITDAVNSMAGAQERQAPGMAQEVAAGAARGAAPAVAGAALGAVVGGGFGSLAGGVGAIPGAAAGAEVGAALVPIGVTIGDLGIASVNKLFGTDYPSISEYINQGVDKLGIPRTETTTGRIAEGITAGLAGAKAAIGAGTILRDSGASTNLGKRVGAFLAEAPDQQFAAAMLAPFGAEGARKLAEVNGLSPEGQELASLAGAFGGAMLGAKAKSIGVTKEFNLPKIEGMTQEAVLKTIQAAEDAGGTIPTSMVFRPQGRVGQFFGNVVEMANPGPLIQVAEDRSQQVKALLEGFGSDVLDSISPAVAADLKATRMQTVKALKSEADSVLSGIDAKGNPVPVQRTLKMLDDEIASLKASAPNTAARDIGFLQSVRNDLVDEIAIPISGELPAKYNPARVIDRIPVTGDPNIAKIVVQGKPIKMISDNLKRWGELVPSESTPISALDKLRKIVYGATKNDISNFILSEAGPDAFKKWSRANKELADMAKETRLTAVRKALNSAELDPKTIDNVLFGGNEAMYKTLDKNLSDTGKRAAQARILQRFAETSIDAATGEVSSTRFLSKLNKNEKLVNTFFKGADKDLIEGTMNFLKLTPAAEAIKKNHLNGSRLFLPGLGGALGAVFSPVAGVAVSSGLWAMAKLYEKPMYREMLMRLSKIKSADAGSMTLVKRLNQALVATATERAVNDLDERKIRIAFNDRAVRQEMIGKGMVLDDSVSGYRIISKDGKKARLMGPTGEPIGYFNSVQDARDRANRLAMMQLRIDVRQSNKQYAP